MPKIMLRDVCISIHSGCEMDMPGSLPVTSSQVNNSILTSSILLVDRVILAYRR
jgi:hypothetical protein